MFYLRYRIDIIKTYLRICIEKFLLVVLRLTIVEDICGLLLVTAVRNEKMDQDNASRKRKVNTGSYKKNIIKS